jgi:hypothetical protein
MEYFRGYQTQCRRVQRLQPPPPLPAFYPPAPSIIDGLIRMFEMRQPSLLSDSFKLSLSRVSQSVGLAPIFSSTDTVPTYALYRGPHTPTILQKRLGWMRHDDHRPRERYQFDWWDRVGDTWSMWKPGVSVRSEQTFFIKGFSRTDARSRRRSQS